MPRPPSSQSAIRQLYVPVCSAGLVYCLSRQYKLADDGRQPYRLAGAVTQECSRVVAWARTTLSSGLLQTQLGMLLCSALVLVCFAVTAAIPTALLLGRLSASEAGRLAQRLMRYLLTQAVLAGSLGLAQQLPLLTWLPWLAGIGELKMFVGLCKDRAAGLSVAPAATLQRYINTLCLLLLVLAADGLAWLLLLWQYQQRQLSWRMCLLFALELAVTAVDAVRAALSCTALLLDEAVAANPSCLQEPAAAAATPSAAAVCSVIVAAWQCWQGRGREAFCYNAELAGDLVAHALTLAHHVHVWVLHGLACQLFDALLLLDARNVLLSALRKLRQHRAHMAATSSLDAAFPDVLTAAGSRASDSADSDSEAAACVICRERMASAKQLPCGHLFHLQCLRAWLQQSSSSSSNGSSSFTCPMCRQPLLLPAAAAAAAGPMPGRQRQLQLLGVSETGVSGYPGLRGASGPSGYASGPPVRSSLMSSLSFGLLSPNELQPSVAAAAAAQHEARLEQLQDRADSWDRDDALMQQQLDSPGTEASYDDVALQEALVASLQDSSAVRSTDSSSSSSSSKCLSRIGNLTSTSSRMDVLTIGDVRITRGSSGGSSRSCSPAAGGDSSPTVLPAATLAGAAATSLVPSQSSAASPQHQYRASSSSIAASTPSCCGSQSSYGSAASSCSAQLLGDQQQQQELDAVESFLLQRFGDPLAESDVLPEAAAQPSHMTRAASNVGRACTRILSSLVSSPRSSSSSSRLGSSSSSSSVSPPCSPAGAVCAGVSSSSYSSRRCASAHAGVMALRVREAAGASCCSSSKHRHAQMSQNRQQEACTPSPTGSRCSVCHKRRHRHHYNVSNSPRKVCQCSNTSAVVWAAEQARMAAAFGSSSAKRALLSKYAALKLDVGQQQDAWQQTGTIKPSCSSSPAFVSPAAAAGEPALPAAGAFGAPAGITEDALGSAEAAAEAAAAVAQLISLPRDPCRRREGGRWGRKRLLGATSPAAAAAVAGSFTSTAAAAMPW